MFRIEDQIEMNTLFNGFLDMMFLMKVVKIDDEVSRFQYTAANDSALMYAGISRDVIGRFMDEVLDKKLAEELQAVYSEAVFSKEKLQFETETFHNGKRQTAVTYLTPIHNQNGICTYLLASVKDITEAKNIAYQLEKSEEQYRILYAEQKNAESLLIGQKLILEMIAKGSSLQDVFNAISLNFEAAIPQSEVCIHLANERDKRLEYFYSANLSESFIQDIHRIEISAAEESCGRAAFTYQPVILSDIEKELKNDEKKRIALQHGVRACWSNPILSSSNQLLGILAVYFKSPSSPDKKEWGNGSVYAFSGISD